MAEQAARWLCRFALLLAMAVVVLPRPGSAQSDLDAAEAAPGLSVFNASAAAAGMQLRAEVPGAPVTNTPVDAGGPSAQATASSTGLRSAYAAFPDPGESIVNAPSLIAGALAAGSGGALPPVSPPDYPFFVQAGVERPEQTAGSGPYRLEARSDDAESRAFATAGFETGAGYLARVRSTSSVVRTAESVVAEATAAAESLSIGPLTIGQVRSTARMTLDPAGRVVPDTALEVTGMRIGTATVSLTPDGLVVGGGTAHGVPAGPTVNDLLAPSKITVELVAAQRHPDRVIAPALRLVFPVDASPSGQGPTMMTAIVGFATALLNGADTDSIGPLPVDPDDSGSATPATGAPTGGPPPFGPEPGPDPAAGGDRAWPADGAGLGGGAGSALITAPAPGDMADSAPRAVAAPAGPAVGIVHVGAGFSLGAIYFTLVASSVGLLILSVLIRELGVRHP